MSQTIKDSLPSPAARRLAAATGASARQIPLKLKHTLTKADRRHTRTGLVAAGLCLSVVCLAASLLTTLPRLGPSPLYAAAGLGGMALSGVPAPSTVKRVAEAVENAGVTTPVEPAKVALPPSVVSAQPSASKPVSSPSAVVVAAAQQRVEPADSAVIVAPIAQKIQSLEERLAALNVAAETERREAEKRAVDRREQDRRDDERRRAEQRQSELNLADQKLAEQRVAANQPPAGLGTNSGPATATASGKTSPCLAAVDAATQAVLVSFDTGSTVVSPVQVEQLKRVAALIKNCPAAQVEVAGHTDSKGALESNFSLSWRRAEAVIAVFQGAGVDPSRFTAVGFGTRRPLSQTAEQQNPIDRRVELKLR